MSREKIKSAQQKTGAAAGKSSAPQDKHTFSFGKENYKLMIAGVAAVAAGMLLMAGGSPEDPTEFSEEIFSFRRIILAPVVIIAGYALVLFSIIKKSKE